jgi:uncharacterized membrane protein HdeD (DUF308 family)
MNSESHTSPGAGDGGPVVAPMSAAEFVKHELHHVRKHWWWFFSLGILLLVCGVLAIVFPAAGSEIAIRVLSIVLMVAGIATIIGSFWAGKWGGFLVQMLVGMIYVAASLVMQKDPLLTVAIITAYVAITFIVMGLFRILATLVIRFPQWGWSLLNGCVTLLLGVVILRDFRDGDWWIIGLLIGIELLFSGLSWIMLSLEIRRIPE